VTVPGEFPSIDDIRPSGVSIRAWQMYKRFPQGSYARVESGPRKVGEVVQICEVVEGMPMRFRVRVNPFQERSHDRFVQVEMRNMAPLNAMEVIAEASR